MSQTTNCAPCCPDVNITEIPGAPGENGEAGADGAAGVNAFTLTTTSIITLPAAAGPVTSPAIQTFSNTAWMAIGQVLIISDPNGTDWASFRVLTLPSGTAATLEWLDYPGDAVGTTPLAIGSQVSPSGVLPILAAPVPTVINDAALIAIGVSVTNTIAAGVGMFTLTIPLTSLATGLGTLAIDLLTTYVPGYAFRLVAFDFVTTVVGAGAGASQTFNLEIGTTNVTGGSLNVTLASTAAIGQLTSGTAITAANLGSVADSISIEMAAGGTVFSSGAGYFVIKMQNFDTANAVASLSSHVNDLIASLP